MKKIFFWVDWVDHWSTISPRPSTLGRPSNIDHRPGVDQSDHWVDPGSVVELTWSTPGRPRKKLGWSRFGRPGLGRLTTLVQTKNRQSDIDRIILKIL